MDYLEAKINQLVIERPGKQKTFVRSFSTKPNRSLNERLGKIFGLFEIESTNQQVPKLIDVIIEEIKNNYYHQKIPALDQDQSTTNEYFEGALKKTNLAIASFLESEQILLDLEKVNIIIGLITKPELHFTVVGNISAVLFYNLTRDNYRIINILDTAKSSVTPPDPIKFFSQVISGRIKPRDILFVSTANILDYFSLERIKNVITAQLPPEGISELKNLLQEVSNKENFGALALEFEKIIIPVKKTFDIQEFNYRQAASKDSIKELIRTEKETEKLLTPSLMPEIKKYLGSFKVALQNYLDKAKSTTVTFYQKKRNIFPAAHLKSRLNLETKIKKINQVGNIFQKTIRPLLLQIKKIIVGIRRQPFLGKISLAIQRLFGNLIAKFKKLPKSSQVLLTITVILAILFTQSIIWLGYKNRREQKIETVNQIIIDVENKKNNAESSLIYRDENQARTLLIEAKNSLKDLNPPLKTQQEKIGTLNKAIDEQLYQLRHIIEITDPIQIVNFQNLDNSAKIANLAIMVGKTLYTQNQNNQSIYKANLNSRVMAAIYSPNVNPGNLILGTLVNNNELIFLNESKAAFLLNPSNDTMQNLTVNINNSADIADLIAYNGRLYLLDRANNQIHRYTKTGNGYGTVDNWLKESSVSLADARSLTIDGELYVLKADGQVAKFLNGKDTDFKVKTIDPPFVSPTKIKTTDNSKYLYILDPPTKRLVVLDKEGNLVNQYTSESFNDLKDFIVVESEKQIYLLNGSSVFGVPATHLK